MVVFGSYKWSVNKIDWMDCEILLDYCFPRPFAYFGSIAFFIFDIFSKSIPPIVIIEFVQIRFHFDPKRLKYSLFHKDNSNDMKGFKLTKNG